MQINFLGALEKRRGVRFGDIGSMRRAPYHNLIGNNFLRLDTRGARPAKKNRAARFGETTGSRNNEIREIEVIFARARALHARGPRANMCDDRTEPRGENREAPLPRLSSGVFLVIPIKMLDR